METGRNMFFIVPAGSGGRRVGCAEVIYGGNGCGDGKRALFG